MTYAHTYGEMVNRMQRGRDQTRNRERVK